MRKFELKIPEERLELLGGSLHPVPFFYSELYELMESKIADGLAHPLSLLDLENWILGAERNQFKNVTGDESFSFGEILDFFSLLLLHHCRKHERGGRLTRIIFDFKQELGRERPGMLPYLTGRMFFRLNQVLFK